VVPRESFVPFTPFPRRLRKDFIDFVVLLAVGDSRVFYTLPPSSSSSKKDKMARTPLGPRPCGG